MDNYICVEGLQTPNMIVALQKDFVLLLITTFQILAAVKTKCENHKKTSICELIHRFQ